MKKIKFYFRLTCFVAMALVLMTLLVHPKLVSANFAESEVMHSELSPQAYDWQYVSSPSIQWFQSVSMLSSTDGWAVGYAGTIIHWDGSQWKLFPTPTTVDLLGVYMVASNNVWAVGEAGVILRWDGVSWKTVSSPTANTLRAIKMVSATDGWIVGGGTSLNVILRWNGSSWSNYPSPIQDGPFLLDIDMLSATNGWAVGTRGTVLHWDGIAWQQTATLTPNYLIGIDMLSATDGWAVGGLTTTSEIFHWNGTSWTAFASPASKEMKSVSMVSSTDGWATSFWGGEILRWNGVAWSIYSTPGGMTSIQMLSSTDGWAVGWQRIMHYTSVATPTPTSTSTPIPTNTPTKTNTPVPTSTPTVTSTSTNTPTLTPASTSTPTSTPTRIPWSGKLFLPALTQTCIDDCLGNDTYTTASGPLILGETIRGALNKPADLDDYYYALLIAGASYRVEVNGNTPNIDLWILDDTTAHRTMCYKGGTTSNETCDFAIATTGKYYIRVFLSYDQTSAGDVPYTLKISQR